MNLIDLFRGYFRRTCLTGYLAIVIIDVIQDAPIIITSFANVDAVHAPNLYFVSEYYRFNIISCSEFYSIDSFHIEVTNCSSTDTTQTLNYAQYYSANYTPSQNVLFSKGSLQSVFLILQIEDDITVDKPVNMNVIGFDSKYDIANKPVNDATPYDDSIVSLNSYQIVPGQIYDFTFSRVIRELIKPSWMNDFGVPPTYEQKPHIVSDLLLTPYMNYQAAEKQISFSIKPKFTNIVQVDKELRTHTYLSGLGLIGGAWGLGAALYGLLFGADALKPWGLVQSYCCGFSYKTRKELKKTLPIIPFYDSSSPIIKNNPERKLSLAEQNELRIYSLELFLQEYVVDVRYLDGVRDKLIKSRRSSSNENKTNDQMVGFDNLNTNSVHSLASTTVATIPSQQQEDQNSTTSDNVIPQSNTTDTICYD
ncbi:hypothetical protein C1645_808518 [Glomus cerebriforme]|uniref:Uncharacterized protein n=1 Tax=Glomus cerebriforme TaxID=658196 RepID=A0A397SQ35_9GLOM|nr:hypothetical protein C1645_808518 [Glomus cerebriforme]